MTERRLALGLVRIEPYRAAIEAARLLEAPEAQGEVAEGEVAERVPVSRPIDEREQLLGLVLPADHAQERRRGSGRPSPWRDRPRAPCDRPTRRRRRRRRVARATPRLIQASASSGSSCTAMRSSSSPAPVLPFAQLLGAAIRVVERDRGEVGDLLDPAVGLHRALREIENPAPVGRAEGGGDVGRGDDQVAFALEALEIRDAQQVDRQARARAPAPRRAARNRGSSPCRSRRPRPRVPVCPAT